MGLGFVLCMPLEILSEVSYYEKKVTNCYLRS